MNNLFTVVFKYGCFSGMIGEGMSVATTGSSGSLHAEVINIKMDINDDDEDVIIATVSITNEAPVPMGGLDVAAVTNSGAKHLSQEGVTSLGPGIQRDWTFEFPLDSGEWTFVLSGSSADIKMGPFAYDFEYSVTQGRKLSSNIGSSLFSGAFDSDLGDFGKVKEREMIDPSKVVLTSYSAENSEGGETKIKADLDVLSTGLTSTSGADARAAPILNPNPVREAPLSQPSRTEDPLLAHAPSSESVREAPVAPAPNQAPVPLIPLNAPPSPPAPPAGPPTALQAGHQHRLLDHQSGPLDRLDHQLPQAGPTGPPGPPPPSGPPTPPAGPTGPSGPPSGTTNSTGWTNWTTLPSGPPTPPAGPPSGPPSGPPTPPPDRMDHQVRLLDQLDLHLDHRLDLLRRSPMRGYNFHLSQIFEGFNCLKIHS